MTDTACTLLPARGVLAVKGDDARTFLQGLVSADLRKLGPESALHAALLTPQGKYLHDFFILDAGESLLLDVERDRLGDLMRRLGLYRLRAKVELRDASGEDAVAVFFRAGAAALAGLADEEGRAAPYDGGLACVDPRLKAAGVRLVLPRAQAGRVLDRSGAAAATEQDYDRHRLALGLPDGSRDLEVEKAILLENGFEELNGVDFDKGCFMGQELTARTKYRGLVKKRLLPVTVDGPLPPPGTPVVDADTRQVGEMRSGLDGLGLALLRLDALEAAADRPGAFTAGEAKLTPRKPDWAVFQADGD